MSEITFQIEASRVLKLLAKEIYDSPLALLRENVQNAYDAVRMRFAASNIAEGRIDVSLTSNEVSISDNGIGMTEDVLTNNFWKPGSSGKHSDEARRAGVVGTFGIGAMANFGVAAKVAVETKAIGQSQVLRSVAERDQLKVGEKCISLIFAESARDFGTTVTATLDPQHSIALSQAREYLEPYVALLPVPLYLNGDLLSQKPAESRLQVGTRQFTHLATRELRDASCTGRFNVSADPNGQVKVVVSDILIGGTPADGVIAVLQGGGQVFGYRSSFGLAPIPVSGHFQFGGIANLGFLIPTAGREALSRESIEIVGRLIALAEKAAAEVIAEFPLADKNNGFMQWVMANGRYDLAGQVTIRMYPDDVDIPLHNVRVRSGARNNLFYNGTDSHIIRTFANDATVLLLISQTSPRRKLQSHYVQNVLQITEVPNTATVTRVYGGNELSMSEGSVLLRIAGILRDDYLIPDVEIVLADISHGVTVLATKSGDLVKVQIARNSQLLVPVLEFYNKAYDLFSQFMKDFVRAHIYPRVQQFVPSSTRDGVEALRRLLERNKELYRYEETERGDLEGVLGDYLAGNVPFSEVFKASRSSTRVQSQSVSRENVGTVEQEIPSIGQSPVQPTAFPGREHDASPPIVRDDIVSDKKLLTTQTSMPQLNGFTMLLGLSDRLMKMEAEFLRTPHTTRIMWGGHRVIYIFTEVTGRLSLYYDIEMREAIENRNTGGQMVPTTTLITKKRIFVPVPDALVEQFKVSAGPREFFVRFDVLSSERPK